jgi:hypothetical protein
MRKATGRTKVHKICIWLDDEEMEKVYLAVYKEKSIPSKIFRKALMSYVDRILNDASVEYAKEDEEPIIL